APAIARLRMTPMNDRDSPKQAMDSANPKKTSPLKDEARLGQEEQGFLDRLSKR
ncbi:2755_t:CDS:2, partial [Acaulospora colombiana]